MDLVIAFNTSKERYSWPIASTVSQLCVDTNGFITVELNQLILDCWIQIFGRINHGE
jgi:hypothetical protein